MNLFRTEVKIDDSRLNSDSQLKIASLVKSLPDDDLSMAWRGGLNVRIIAAQVAKKKQRSKRRVFGWGVSLSGSMTVAAVAVMMANSSSLVSVGSTSSSPAIASELVRAHQESLVLASVSGAGSSNHETSIVEDSYGLQDDLL